MMKSRICAVLFVTAASWAPLPAQDSTPTTSKVDVGLENPGTTYPVFVRMADQVFPRAGDYEAFCEANRRRARSKLREEVSGQLAARADASWKAVAEQVAELEGAGALQQLRRFWIVNGFACDATGAACAALAERPEVAFVYHQVGPKKQHENKPRGPKQRRKGREDIENALALWSEDPEFKAEGFAAPSNLEKIGAKAAWESGALGQGVVIALCESGVLVAPQLVGGLWRNPDEEFNEEDDDGNGLVDDIFGYDFTGDTPYSVGDEPTSGGSMVAGVLIGRPHQRAFSGIAPRARLMMLRDTGSLQALEYAITEGADVFVMSYKFGKRPLGNWAGVFRTAFEHMAACGVVPVAGAVGAEKSRGEKSRNIIIPVDIPAVISTAATQRAGRMPGATTVQPDWTGVVFCEDAAPTQKPDLAGLYGGFPVWSWAPGVARRQGEDPVDLLFGPGNDELPAPHAGGVAALMLSANSELAPWRIKALMQRTTKRADKRGPFGAGLVMADRAVAAAKKAKIDEE